MTESKIKHIYTVNLSKPASRIIYVFFTHTHIFFKIIYIFYFFIFNIYITSWPKTRDQITSLWSHGGHAWTLTGYGHVNSLAHGCILVFVMYHYLVEFSNTNILAQWGKIYIYDNLNYECLFNWCNLKKKNSVSMYILCIFFTHYLHQYIK